MSADHVARVERACVELTDTGRPVTFTAVAARSGVGRATLYRNPALRVLVEEHRARAREAHTLSGLATEIAQLRTSLEAVADRVRRHEEVLRHLDTRERPIRPASGRRSAG